MNNCILFFFEKMFLFCIDTKKRSNSKRTNDFHFIKSKPKVLIFVLEFHRSFKNYSKSQDCAAGTKSHGQTIPGKVAIHLWKNWFSHGPL